MNRIIFISGTPGSGKTQLSNQLARNIVNESDKTVYIIHGDDFHQGFVEPENKGDFFINGEASNKDHWNDILRFNWGCIIDTADRALKQNMDVVIDYVIEDELPMIKDLAIKNNAELCYIVLTAANDELIRRITIRGDLDMIDRSLFLKERLEAMNENRGHIIDTSSKSTEEIIESLDLNRYKVKLYE